MIEPNIIRKQRRTLAILLVLTVATAITGMAMGYGALSFDRLIPTLIGQGSFKESFILFSVRLPRIVITLLAGMALALSGCILQSITRNDLADPGIIGINSGAGVGIAIYFLFFPINTTSFIYILTLVAFCSALLTVLIIYIFSYKRRYVILTRTQNIIIRYIILFTGLLIMAFGIAVVAKSNSGTTPISSVPFVLSLIFPITFGQFTCLLSILFMIAEFVILGRDFPKAQLWQIIIGPFFGIFSLAPIAISITLSKYILQSLVTAYWALFDRTAVLYPFAFTFFSMFIIPG